MRERTPGRHHSHQHGPRRPLWVVCVLVAVVVGSAGTGCGGGDGGEAGQGAGGDTGGNALAGDRVVAIGAPIPIGNATVTVRALQDAFQPVTPPQRLSETTPDPPAAGESFYQAYVRVDNQGQLPLRVDPEHFACKIGSVISRLEPTRSGPPARSLIHGTSMDLLLTFRGPAGQDPLLIYTPPWYDGVITFSAGVQAAVTTTVPPPGP